MKLFGISLALVTGILAPVVAQAAPSSHESLLSYLVFAKQDIAAGRSDFQGKTGAGANAYLTDFFINGDLVAGTSVAINRGSVNGTIVSPSVQLTKASYQAKSLDKNTSLYTGRASLTMDQISFRVDKLAATSSASVGKEVVQGRDIVGLKISAQQPLEVVDVQIADLESHRNLILEGNGSSNLVVRIHGESVHMVNMGTFVTRGLAPRQVLFYFPEASLLRIAGSGGAQDPSSNVQWGIPGSVLAPCADAMFSSALVTGRFYAQSITSESDKPAGQVNASPSDVLTAIAKTCACN